MGGSQLTQLKAALSSAGLARKTHSKKEKKEWKKGGAREVDRVKQAAKLEDIRRGLNKFDVRETKVKHDVGGRNLKGVTGRPTAAKQAGLEARKKSLLPEHELRHHRGTFLDRRFGEADPSMSMDDRMLERYTRERQAGQGRKGMFNLEDEDGDVFGDLEEGNALGGLTHGGRDVDQLQGDDDFVAQGLGDADEEDEDLRFGRLGRDMVRNVHFGGFGDNGEDGAEGGEERKKTKQEVMAEVIAKSKAYKLERQLQNERDAETREELDANLDEIRALLEASSGPTSTPGAGPSRPPATIPPVTGANGTSAFGSKRGAVDDDSYDKFVRSLQFDARARPTDRTKTEDELALEEKERLEQAEKQRLKRMRGELDSEDEDEHEGNGRRRRGKKGEERAPEGDDLGGDWEEELLGPGLTREGLESMALPIKGSDDEASDDGEEDEDDDADDDADEDEDSGQGEEAESDEESGEAEADDESEDDEVEEAEDDLDSLDGEPNDETLSQASDENAAPIQLVSKSTGSKGKAKTSSSTTKEIPYTFPCPASVDEFEEALDGLDDTALPVVVQRIRALHHPSLAQGNKEKLQDFLGVLLDYTLVLASRPAPAFQLIDAVYPHIVALVKLNPLSAAPHFIAKLQLMQKNLTRGLASGPSRAEAKTFPGAPELVILRLVGTVWSTSDFAHPVVMPAMLLMSQYLGQSRVRTTRDLTSGLFLCSLIAQYEAESKRLVPEATNFIAAALLALLPRKKNAAAITAFPDLLAPDASFRITELQAPRDPVNLTGLLSQAGTSDSQIKADLLSAALRLSQTSAEMYVSSDAFIELFTPISVLLSSARPSKLASPLQLALAQTIASLERMLSLASTSRQPLALQAHKPIPIPSHAPNFESDFAPGRHYDPDAERNAAQKLKAQYRKERKGAIRELRKDNRFMQATKEAEQSAKDREYELKMRRAHGEIGQERAEEKEMAREKKREKRRAGNGKR